MKRPAVIASFLAVGFAGPGGRLLAADPRVEALETEYRARREALIKPLTASYEEKLKALEESFVRTGDAVQLAAVKRERERLRQPVPSVPPSPVASTAGSGAAAATPGNEPAGKPSGPVVQTARWTGEHVVGGGSADGGLPAVTAKGPPVAFKPFNLAPGRYRVTLALTTFPPSGGVFRLTLNERSYGVTLEKIEEALGRTEVALGDYEHRGGPVTLKVEQNEGKAGGGVAAAALDLRRPPER